MSVAQPVMVVAHSCVSLEMTWAVMVVVHSCVSLEMTWAVMVVAHSCVSLEMITWAVMVVSDHEEGQSVLYLLSLVSKDSHWPSSHKFMPM